MKTVLGGGGVWMFEDKEKEGLFYLIPYENFWNFRGGVHPILTPNPFI